MSEPAPRARLVAMTDEARAALGNREHVRLTIFPFRIGRESRSTPLARVVDRLERRLNTAPQLNELYLLDPSSPDGYQISREHCAIEWVEHHFVLVDRGSALGSTIVESRREERPVALASTQVGGPGADVRSVIRDGDVIVLGALGSSFAFRFDVDRAVNPPVNVVDAR